MKAEEIKLDIKNLLNSNLNIKKNLRELHRKIFELYSLYELDKKYKKSKVMDDICLVLDKLMNCLVMNKYVDHFRIEHSIIKILGV